MTERLSLSALPRRAACLFPPEAWASLDGFVHVLGLHFCIRMALCVSWDLLTNCHMGPSHPSREVCCLLGVL